MFIVLIAWCRQWRQFKLYVLISFFARCFTISACLSSLVACY